MMTHAYSQLYLSKASRAVGNMLHEKLFHLFRLFLRSQRVRHRQQNCKFLSGISGQNCVLAEDLLEHSGKVQKHPVSLFTAVQFVVQAEITTSSL